VSDLAKPDVGVTQATVEVRDLLPSERAAAVALLARGMRDNPLNVAAYGEDAERRRRSLERMFAALFRVFGAQRPICALDSGALVAVAGIAPPGTCQPTALQRLRFVPSMIAIGPGSASRVGKWLAAWGERDPDRPHSHLGPVAVEPGRQGRGIGSLLMTEYCRRLDAAGEISYLETDKRENVRFYERHGYAVIDQAEVTGVPNWFMLREPQRSA
jgi:GNAT superfamily N-acetyltransferase